MNIDITSRRAAASLLRQFASGRLTNDEFEDQWPVSGDPALSTIREVAWFLYSDLRTHRLAGPNRLPFPIRRQVARWVSQWFFRTHGAGVLLREPTRFGRVYVTQTPVECGTNPSVDSFRAHQYPPTVL